MIGTDAWARPSSIRAIRGFGRRLLPRFFFFGLGFFPRCVLILAAMGTSDRRFLTDWYLRNRQRSKMLFDAVVPAAYESRPISLRNPICFHEGHLAAFAANTLLRGALKQPPVDAGAELVTSPSPVIVGAILLS